MVEKSLIQLIQVQDQLKELHTVGIVKDQIFFHQL